jgi:Holliday junction resolvase RusA-like endonuclease
MDKKPDRDNLDKAVLDALTRCKFWLDDCQVCAGNISKQYTLVGVRPGVYISVWQLEESVRYEE